MKTKDHYDLARYMTEPMNISKWKRAAFCFGNIEPDYNRISYMGRRKEHFANGHSYHCRKKQIFAFLDKPCTDSLLWWYRAGKVFHYIGDSFSRPHNPEFGYSSADHVKYEFGLHDIVMRALKGNPWKVPEINQEIQLWLELRHQHYMERTKGPQDDCYYIFTTMMAMWNWVVGHKL